MDLRKLIKALPEYDVSQAAEISISGITHDSRHIQSGWLFVAVQGKYFDGHSFINDAIHRGAVAVVGTQQVMDLPIPYIRVPDSRVALAYLSAAFYNFPSHQLTMIGITGTDGKTTTANLIYHLLQTAGERVGMITTVNAVIGDKVLDTGYHVTTPEAPQVQHYLRQMVDYGITHVVLEATSHGLAQERVSACDFDVGVITNITHEHLDYHGTQMEYRAAKSRLFMELSQSASKSFNPPRFAIMNRDDISYDYLAEITRVKQLSYGFHPQADVRAEDVIILPKSLKFFAVGCDLNGEAFRFEVSTNLVGNHNLSNCLAAVTLGRVVFGFEDQIVVDGIAALKGIPGRMEAIEMGQDFTAIVDFAHTPNALLNVLKTARELTSGQVIAVFGSAGLRDREKRRMMAEVSIDLADLTVFTVEDPRSESLDNILGEMVDGAITKGGVEGKTFWRIRDRGRALRFALDLAHSEDIVIVCGKGHEQSMCFGEIEYPWDDRTALRAALSDYLGINGPKMPYLPTQDEE